MLLSNWLGLLGVYQGISWLSLRVFKVGYQSVSMWLPGCSGWFQGVARVVWMVSRALLGGLLRCFG